MGAGGDLSREAVHSVVEGLECSPSKHDDSGSYGGKPNITPTAKSTKSAEAGHFGDHTTEFNKTDRGRPLPNYKGQYAKKAQEI